MQADQHVSGQQCSPRKAESSASASAMGQWLPRDGDWARREEGQGWICMQVLLIFAAIYLIFLEDILYAATGMFLHKTGAW